MATTSLTTPPATGSHTDAPAAVHVRDVVYRYGDVVALRGIAFDVQPAEIFGLLGPNGGGKSTLFRLLSTLVPPQQGTLHVLGHDLWREPNAVRRLLGVVFQSPALDVRLTVEENLRHAGHLYGLRGRAAGARIGFLLERFGLADRRKHLVSSLSGGLQRRVELAKCLLHEPRVLVLDEPSTGLDPAARRELWRHLEDVRADGVTVLLTSHILEEVEGCDRVAILDRGRLVAAGSPGELKARIGGDVITFTSDDPAALAEAIRARFGLEPQIVDGTVRLEHERGPVILKEIVEALPDAITAVTLSKPTLEDVFIDCTGHAFWEERS